MWNVPPLPEGKVRVPRPPPVADNPVPAKDYVSPARGEIIRTARLSYRLKTFTWDAAYDEAWLQHLHTTRRPPDAIVLSFGIWDMQYPPGAPELTGAGASGASGAGIVEASSSAPGNAATAAVVDVERGVKAFKEALSTFLERLNKAMFRLGRRPRLFWLSVTAVTEDALPEWKRSRMTRGLAKRYNAVASTLMHEWGVDIIDTHTSGASHPTLTSDGVHFGNPVSRLHSQLFWGELCADFNWYKPWYPTNKAGTSKRELRARRRRRHSRALEEDAVDDPLLGRSLGSNAHLAVAPLPRGGL